MTRTPDQVLAELIAALDDPAERYEAVRREEATFGTAVRTQLQQIALDLKATGKTWREVGEIMGGVSPQRAEQISRGV